MTESRDETTVSKARDADYLNQSDASSSGADAAEAVDQEALDQPPIEVRPRRRGTTPEEDAVNRRFAIETARLLADFDCEDVIILDVSSLSDLSDYLVMATGASDRQIRSLAGRVEDLGKEKFGLHRYGREQESTGDVAWLLVDFIDVVVHLFDPSARAHYDLEMLWGDAKRVSWHRGIDEARQTPRAEARSAEDAPEAEEGA